MFKFYAKWQKLTFNLTYQQIIMKQEKNLWIKEGEKSVQLIGNANPS